MNLREARADEAALISDMAFRSKAYWGYSDAFMEACRQELTFTPEDCARMYVALIEDPLAVGFCALERLSRDEVALDALFVVPEVIGRGYGRALVEHAMGRAREMGATAMTIQGDPNAEGFYLAMGATSTGRRESASIPGRYLPTFAIGLG